ncbi:ADP-ribosylation factor-like protein 2-binding protein [Hondaea fermentalgiana]|uniref:ADP-ribosylation factor-like protein 2-binding protein n=1 Tax=Hondaea fermentalgiana TaxID=2315210 RepID=A0A2R5GPI5_9STRA|nr:ADP-ribosylation factor-like protein 2-binding protein [Hondaea fermentalgiana]|eukprot:GBG30533.1 ADP-ribosylation factor-like protein 2-binding protein [Hondaea fermentalgiana]
MAEYGFESKAADESKSGDGGLDRISKISHGLDDFYREHLHEFDPDEEENKLEYWEIFKEFEALFESYLEEFMEDQKLDRAEFREQLNEVAEGVSEIL